MAFEFVEKVLDLGYDYGAQGGPIWSTTIVESGGGAEQANVNWSQPKGRWQLGDRTASNPLTQNEHDYLYHFWMARHGQSIGFRYKDWNDFELIDEEISLGDGSKKNFQIIKGYDDFRRTIQKINPDTIEVRVNNKLQPYTLDKDTGVISFVDAPNNGRPITVSCEFHVPVRFEQDEWSGKFLIADPDRGVRYYELGPLTVRAIRTGEAIVSNPLPPI